MKYTLLAAAAVMALATPVMAQGLVSSPPTARDVASGGYADNNVAAATGSIQSSLTGEGNMNGPYGNGKPDDPYPTNTQAANMQGQAQNLDPNAPPPAYIGQAASN